MEHESAFVALAIALGVGLLMGFEREQSADHEGAKSGSSLGGIRTFPVVALAGALATLLARELGAWFVAAPFAAITAFVVVSYVDDVREGRERGLTSEIAMLAAYLLGALAPTERIFATTKQKTVVLFSVAVVASLVLSLKPALHALARKATKDDVYATLKFLLVAVVVLPLLPDRTYGPLDVLNPFKIGVLIVLIAGVGFAGYVAVRALGPGRGLGVTGLVGGLVSSTAVTLGASAHAKREPKLRASCALAIVLANTVMAVRLVVVVVAASPPLARMLAIPVAAVVAVGCAASFLFWRRAKGAAGKADKLALSNPFELMSAVKMGAVITVVLFASKAAAVHVGAGAVYATAVLAGATDVDAISVSMAQLAGTQMTMPGAATAVLLALAANTVTKAVMASVVGGWEFGRTVLAAAAATLGAALAGIAFVWM
jgi:uncharacterized membrane protein (DUF4010 family)